MITNNLGSEGFSWFIGISEALNDPLKLGRVRVRVLNFLDDVPVDSLPWASVLLPTTSGSVDGVGQTPALAVGTRVFGFFMDGNEKQMPVIIGVIPTIPSNDPQRHSLPWLARGNNTLIKEKLKNEPDTSYAAEYPYNNVMQTSAGHVIEIDNTPENSRIHIYHAAGSYIEINHQGRIIIKSVDDSYDLTGGNKTMYVKGDCNINVDGTCHISSQDTAKIESKKGITLKAPGGVTVSEGSLTVEKTLAAVTGATGTFTSITGSNINVQNGIVTSIG